MTPAAATATSGFLVLFVTCTSVLNHLAVGALWPSGPPSAGPHSVWTGMEAGEAVCQTVFRAKTLFSI